VKETNNKRDIDFLERKVVFRISRIISWILLGIGGLGFIVSFFFLLFSLFPPTKERVAKPELPPKVTIDLSEIERVITPPPPKEKKMAENKVPKEKIKPTPPPPSPQEVALKAKIDTLASYFPPDKFTWKTVYKKVVIRSDAWGNPVEWGKRVEVWGLDNYLIGEYGILKLYPEIEEKIDVVDELIGIISKIPVEKRKKALKAYVSLRKKKERERKREIARIKKYIENQRYKAEIKYLAKKAKKAKTRMKALIAFGVAFVSVAIWGLFLVFLAIERNTRAIQEMTRKVG